MIDTAPPPSPVRAQRSHRILLVDDNAEFTDILKTRLLDKRDPSWIVHTATDYAGALNCLKSNAMDLVVLDISMPVMDGLQLLPMLKRNHPALPVVLLSGLVTPENREYALQHGASLVLSKMDIAGGFESLYPALEATAEMPAEGFRGMVRQVGLSEVLQLECLGRKSSILEIKGPSMSGRIYISEGSLVHAEAGDVLGEKALAKLFGLKGGEFHLKAFTPPPRVTIEGSWEGLLMEAAQTSDELAGQEAERELAAAQSTPESEAALPKVDVGRQIEEVVLSAGTSGILYQWNSPQADKRVNLLDWLSSHADKVTELLPALGRADRLEIDEPKSRVICVLQHERRVFVRVTITTPEAQP